MLVRALSSFSPSHAAAADVSWVSAWLFLAVSTYQMVVWAVKKHRNYKKEFGKEYPRGRKAMFPFIF